MDSCLQVMDTRVARVKITKICLYGIDDIPDIPHKPFKGLGFGPSLGWAQNKDLRSDGKRMEVVKFVTLISSIPDMSLKHVQRNPLTPLTKNVDHCSARFASHRRWKSVGGTFSTPNAVSTSPSIVIFTSFRGWGVPTFIDTVLGDSSGFSWLVAAADIVTLGMTLGPRCLTGAAQIHLLGDTVVVWFNGIEATGVPFICTGTICIGACCMECTTR